MIVLSKFMTKSRNPERDGALYNMIASVLNSFQSVILLMVLTRAVGTEESGIFTIAFSYSNMFLMIGKYGMRHYQVSDGHQEYSFRQYRLSRWISSLAMLLTAAIYICTVAAMNDYSGRKQGIMLWMILFRLPDAIEDIYYGWYQQQGRLDVASKAMSVRMLIEIASYLALAIVTRNQYIALVGGSIINGLGLCYVLHVTRSAVKDSVYVRSESEVLKCHTSEIETIEHTVISDLKASGRLLMDCFPLFLGSFLTIYVTNAPKYAIDAVLSDVEQAYYGYISMPVSMIGLLSGFLFIPMLYDFTRLWDEGKIRPFCRKIASISAVVGGITVACAAAAYLLGIPVLSVLFHADLQAYRTDLVILLIGGGFSALTAFFNAIVTVMRRQRHLLAGYIVTAILAVLISNCAVQTAGVRGASILFMALMGTQCIWFAIVMIIAVCSRKQQLAK